LKDGVVLASTSSDRAVFLPAEPGEHRRHKSVILLNDGIQEIRTG
jgi:hypothetical protein